MLIDRGWWERWKKGGRKAGWRKAARSAPLRHDGLQALGRTTLNHPTFGVM